MGLDNQLATYGTWDMGGVLEEYKDLAKIGGFYEVRHPVSDRPAFQKGRWDWNCGLQRLTAKLEIRN